MPISNNKPLIHGYIGPGKSNIPQMNPSYPRNPNPATNVQTTSTKLTKDPPKIYHGGNHEALKDPITGKVIPGTQINHIPPSAVMRGVPGWTYGGGPAIQMDYKDHREARTTGWSSDTQAYQQKLKQLVDNGQVGDAIALDVEDIQGKFGSKYDDALREMIRSKYPEWKGYGPLEGKLGPL